MPVNDPELLPLLARGRHRTPRRGACFMELAGYLAGERWSDHPACTHPLLARLARGVNDLTSDDARPRLAILIPSVIGLVSTDPRWDHAIALAAATTALPVAPEERQRALAVGILTLDGLLAPDPSTVAATLRARARAALEDVPLAARWAEGFAAQHGGGRVAQHPGPAVVDVGVQAVALTGRPDTDALLRAMLDDAITVCQDLAGAADRPQPVLDPERWPLVCAPAPARAR